jgi:aminoglycoside phosphotransferase (APT) family kinase protein
MIYLGHLPTSDPVYGYLRFDILPQIRASNTAPDFRVYRIQASNRVFLYKDRRSNARVIGKYFASADLAAEVTCHRMEREFQNLSYLRSLGFAGYPHYIARPLGRNGSLSCLLVVEYCYGTPFNDVIVRAIQEGARDLLFQKLTALAYFLATLHNRTGKGTPVDFGRESTYFEEITQQLRGWGHIGHEESRELLRLRDVWRDRGCMWEDQQVLVHGDLTPTNVLFGDGPWVIALDLERMKARDRAFDLGRVAAEIKHFFLLYAGNGGAAEPFIGHFLWEYATHFPDRQSAFAAVTRRLPFYMALTEIRIARNSWISDRHRRLLLEEAKKALR